MKPLFPVMIVYCFVFSAGNSLKEKRSLHTLVSHHNDSVSSYNFIRTNYFTDLLAVKIPPKISHPSITLESVSPNLFMQLVAGTSTDGFSGDNGPATSAQLRSGGEGSIPWVDTIGNIFIPDKDNFRIRKVSPGGIITTFGGTSDQSFTGASGPISSVSFFNPVSIVGDIGGTVLYISDRIYVWKYLFSSGIVSVVAGTSSGFSGDSGPATSAQVHIPAGLWLTTADVLFFSDFANHRIRKVSSGIITTVAGSGCTNYCLGRYSGDNGPATTATLNFPVGIYMDTSGKLYIADEENFRIRLVGTNNIITTFAGSGTNGPFNGDNIQALSANLNNPHDVKGDSLGNIYIADRSNCIIRMVDTTGIISTVFGTPGSCGFSSGISSRTSVINGPYGIWLDSLSNIYFSDGNSIHRSVMVSSPTSQPSGQPSGQPSRQPNVLPPRLFDNIQLPHLNNNQGFKIFGKNTVGTSVSGIGDFNNDGYDDIVLGAYNAFASNSRGVAYVIYGYADGFTDFNVSKMLRSEGFYIIDYVGLQFGWDVCGAGDFNNDGFDDLIISSNDRFFAAFLLFGKENSSNVELYSGYTVPANAGVFLYYNFSIPNQRFGGIAVSGAGDINRDGYDDILIGALHVSTCYVIFGKSRSFVNIDLGSLAPPDGFVIYGSLGHDFGASVSSAGDMNADGYNDIIIGSPWASNRDLVLTGGAYIIFGKRDNFTNIKLSTLAHSQGFSFKSCNYYEQAGFSVGTAGDFDDDGFDDVIVGIPNKLPMHGGSYILFGNSTLSNIECSVFPSQGLLVTGPHVGFSVAILGDVNKDGYSDIILGASGYNHWESTNHILSAIYVVFGRRNHANIDLRTLNASSGFIINGTTINNVFGIASGAGDFNKDGYPDILVGSWTNSAYMIVNSAATASPTSFPSSYPSLCPSTQPSQQPSTQPSCQPSSIPTVQPTLQPVSRPTSLPSILPSQQPLPVPSGIPSIQPTGNPSGQPSCVPSIQPTGKPSSSPSMLPTSQPSSQPSTLPSSYPSDQPTCIPTAIPTISPSECPSSFPSTQPSALPSIQPSDQPTNIPSRLPTSQPTIRPTGNPSWLPSSCPSCQPTCIPTSQPTDRPSCQPTVIPSNQPLSYPSSQPTSLPSKSPSCVPTLDPTSYPTKQPSSLPTAFPSVSPSSHPTILPSNQPSSHPSSQPTVNPTMKPTGCPTTKPSSVPSLRPSTQPSSFPSTRPSQQPSSEPNIRPSFRPSSFPTVQPASRPSLHPSSQPSNNPTNFPTGLPSRPPTCKPSSQPTCQPVSLPSSPPTGYPTLKPICCPSTNPTSVPSLRPIGQPSSSPSTRPSLSPSSFPTVQPSCQPSRQPSRQPTSKPSKQPSSSPTSLPTCSPISSFPTSIPTIMTDYPTPLRNPSISAYPSQTRKPTRQPVTPRPTSVPTVRPSFIPTFAPTQTISVFPSGNINFKESLFLFGSYLPAVENIPNIYLTEENIGSSFIIFGFKQKERTTTEIIIGSRNSQGLYSPIMNETGLRQDHTMSRTALPIGDFNGDTYSDLLICDPMNSCCFAYFGHVNGLQNLQVSYAIKSNNNDLFGWSIAKLNDINKDNYADVAISALSFNMIYLFFGSNSNTADILIDRLDSSVGIEIIGSQNDQNTGLALSSAGDFNNDGYSDILFSAIQITPYQNVIYILFLNSRMVKQNIIMDDLIPNKDYFKITAPLFSLAGFSLSNLGDINQDGFDDIIIGSIPYSGRYLTQKSYVIYGRDSSNAILLTEMREEDGFTISGGGFMVAGPGDVNGDGIPDIMVSSYQQWQGKGNSYIMVYPRNVTSPPTFLPTSQPSSLPSYSPTSLPSLRVHDPTSTPTFQETTNEPVNEGTFPPFLEKTQLPSLAPKTSKPTRAPSTKSTTHSPTFKTNPPSLQPSRKPTADPTRRPTIVPSTTIPSRSPTQRYANSHFPTSTPSVAPTVSLSTQYQEIAIDSEGVYNVPKGKANYIISGEGAFEITSNGGGKKLYTILPSKNTVTVTSFNKRYDQISLIHFPYLYSINDLVYRTHPLQIFLSREQKLVLSSMDASELTEDNFIFQKDNEDHKRKTKFRLDLSAVVSLGILIGCVGIFGCVSKLNKEDAEDERKMFVENVRESDKELNDNLSSDFGSLLLSSSDGEREDEDDEFSIPNSSNRNEEEREVFENDWNLFSSLQSFFSRDNDDELNDDSEKHSTDVEGYSWDPYIDDMFNASEAEEKQEESDNEFDNGGIDIEGNYQQNDDDEVEGDISFIQQLFNNILQH
jgi:hypothetical protein